MSGSNKQTVLVVDDTPANIDVLVGILKDEYIVKAVLNGSTALELARKSPPDIILLDVMMPEIDGYEVCRRLKADLVTRNIPIIFVTAKIEVDDEIRGFELGAVDYIGKPLSPPIVKARVKTQLALYDQNRELDKKVRQSTDEIIKTRLKIIQRLGKAAEFKDNETGLHVIRMSKYSYFLGREAGLSESDAELLMNAAPMHDVGKIGIPDNILKKPGKLTDEEFAIMKEHPQIGVEMIGEDESELLKLASEVALTHHEKWNGCGYPNRLSGEDIPLSGRIVAIADVFDALTSERPYKRAWSVEESIALLEKESGQHFDPNLIPLFLKVMPEILKVKEEYKEDF